MRISGSYQFPEAKFGCFLLHALLYNEAVLSSNIVMRNSEQIGFQKEILERSMCSKARHPGEGLMAIIR